MQQPMHRRALSADLSAKFDLGPQPDAETVAQHIGLVTDAVVDATLHKYDALHPGYLLYSPQKQVNELVEGCYYHLEFLASVVRNDTPAVYAQQALWLVNMLHDRDGNTDTMDQIVEMMVQVLELLGQELRLRLGDGAWMLLRVPLDAALAAVQKDTSTHHVYTMPPANALMGAYLNALLKGNRLVAQELSLNAMNTGLSLADIYTQIFQPALYEVGRLWEVGQVSVAQEHLATAITQSVISVLYAQAKLPPSRGEAVIVACMEENYHEIGARMAADVLQLAGYDAYFLGANAPQDSLIAMIDEIKPVAIGLSSTLPNHVDTVRNAIDRVRSTFSTHRPAIILGGISFNTSEGLWQRVGGDVWGSDVRLAVKEFSGVEL